MIHYHGLPITPDSAAAKVIAAAHAFVSFRHPSQLGLAAELSQSFAVDNGAFSAWRAGEPVQDWSEYYIWVDRIALYPNFDFAVIPDVIDGSENDNDRLVECWPFRGIGVPVWHLHESLDRLKRLVRAYPRIAIGSSGEYAQIKSPAWWRRMSQAMKEVCAPDGLPLVKLHGLRMLDPVVVERFPFASADSTNIARNIGIDVKWNGGYAPATKDMRALILRERIERARAPIRWESFEQQEFSLTGDENHA